MCGHDWCSVRISKEIVEFASGKEAEYQWDRAKVSAALTPEQQAILEQRGVLSPAEIHRLASKVRGRSVRSTTKPNATATTSTRTKPSGFRSRGWKSSS